MPTGVGEDEHSVHPRREESALWGPRCPGLQDLWGLGLVEGCTDLLKGVGFSALAHCCHGTMQPPDCPGFRRADFV